MELIDFVQSQASALSVADLDRLIADLPALRERFTTIPSQTYPYLSDHLEFLSLVVKDEVTGPTRDPISQTLSEAAFALLYFQTATDLIPDPIPGMGLLGVDHSRGNRRSLCYRLSPGDLWHYARSVHHLHFQRLRYPWFALAVFPACRCRSQVCLP